MKSDLKLTAVIVEDEEASREILAGYLAKYCKDVVLLGMADSVNTGVELIQRTKPDIVFLDVEMPFGNAFDLLEQIDEIKFETVFVTAYSNYAVKALNFSASYYILKPVDIDELIAAVEKIRQNIEKKDHSMHSRVLIDNIKNANKQLHKIVLPLLDGFQVIQVKDIVRCQANDNFTNFHFTNNTRMVICRTLKFYDELLSDFDFIRVHKSHLVNLNHIIRYKKGKGGQLIMSDDSYVDVSPSRKNELLSRF